jgi:hypothetical protein
MLYFYCPSSPIFVLHPPFFFIIFYLLVPSPNLTSLASLPITTVRTIVPLSQNYISIHLGPTPLQVLCTMPNPFSSRHRQFELQNNARPKHKSKMSKPNTKHKPKPKSKQTRATRSTNWRSRSTTPAATMENDRAYCECGCTSSYKWSEDSIQHQLSYLVPVSFLLSPHDELPS